MIQSYRLIITRSSVLVFKSLNNNIYTKPCDHVSFRSNYKSHQSKTMNKGSFYLYFYVEIIKPIYKYNFSVLFYLLCVRWFLKNLWQYTDFEQQSYVSINNNRSRLTGKADWRSTLDSVWGTTTNIYQHMH